MVRNRVKQLRGQLGLSQRKLAEMVGTSQQQIQRVETEAVAARLELATKLSKALGKPLEVVFPGSGRVLKRLAREAEGSHHPPEETFSELSQLGVEGDPRIWFVNILLRGHEAPLIFEISAGEKRRLFGAIQEENAGDGAMSFVVFEASSQLIAVNLSELIYCHFLFEPGNIIRDGNDPSEEVRVFFSGSDKSLSFGVDPEVGRQDETGEEYDQGEFRQILVMLEGFTERHERFCFTDRDGEDVFLRIGDIALLEVPLCVVDPAESSDDEEVEIEDMEGGHESSVH